MLEQPVVEEILLLSANTHPSSRFFTTMLRSKASLERTMEAI